MLEQYLDTLERIPDEIVLSLMTRDLNLDQPSQCICGWVVREALARAAGKDADEVTLDEFNAGVVKQCVDQFGGEFSEWSDIYHGVTYSEEMPVIERALMLRVLEAMQ